MYKDKICSDAAVILQTQCSSYKHCLLNKYADINKGNVITSTRIKLSNMIIYRMRTNF